MNFNTTTYHRLMRCFAIAATCMLSICGISAFAQNNPAKIHDSLYPIYKRASQNRTKPVGLRIADTLYMEAKKINDTRAQCLAYTIPVFYHFYRHYEPPMLEAVNKLKAISEKYGQEVFYYNACNNYVNFLISIGEHYRAMEYAIETQKYAEKHKSKIGTIRSLLALGYIHIAREENSIALTDFNEALKFAKAYGFKDELPNIYYRLCLCYNYDEIYDESIKYAKLCLETAQSESHILYSKCYLCDNYFFTHQYDKFLPLYREVCALVNDGINDIRMSNFKYITIMYNIIMKNYDLALKMCDSIGYAKQRYYFYPVIYYHKGDYKNAAKSFKRYVNFMDSSKMMLSFNDLSHQHADINKYILSDENQNIKLENIQLELANSKLNLDKAQRIADTEKINAERSRLAYLNRELETENMQAAQKKQKIQQEQQEQQNRDVKARLSINIIIVCALVAISLAFLLSRIILSRRLKKKHQILEDRNKELKIAQEKADQDDKMKAIFLQNMSHEIRTPLNAIVGFSQIIADDEDELTESDKNDFSNRIEENSDIVLTIINDILDLTSIESGHYKMKISNVKLNELCRTSIKHFSGEVAESVKLLFTTDFADDFTIQSDSLRISQVIQNLLSNSAKNTTVGSIRLHCSSSSRSGFIDVVVTDTGIGIPSKYADKIFERFFKIDDLKQGVGLGLSISHDIATFLGGVLYLDTNYTDGARFVFEIPVNSN